MNLQGYRTYVVAALGVALILCDANNVFVVPESLKDTLLFVCLAFLRAGVK